MQLLSGEEKILISTSVKENKIIESYNEYFDENEKWFIFMNDGYCPLNEYNQPTDFIDLYLSEKYKIWKYQVYMYLVVLNHIHIRPFNSKKNLLEVGCGRGGGLSFISDYYKFKNLTGVDINNNHINFAKEHTTGINFLTASATKMPIEDKSMDIIISIESSSYYEPFKDYVSEVKRILKDDGVYVRAERYIQNPDEFLFGGFEIIKTENIDDNTRMSCSISKWSFKKDFEKISNIFRNDEQEYINNNTFYNIRSYRKISQD